MNARIFRTENLTAERYFSEFDQLATVLAAKRNLFFKANQIRDDLMLVSTMDEQTDRSPESSKNMSYLYNVISNDDSQTTVIGLQLYIYFL